MQYEPPDYLNIQMWFRIGVELANLLTRHRISSMSIICLWIFSKRNYPSRNRSFKISVWRKQKPRKEKTSSKIEHEIVVIQYWIYNKWYEKTCHQTEHFFNKNYLGQFNTKYVNWPRRHLTLHFKYPLTIINFVSHWTDS